MQQKNNYFNSAVPKLTEKSTHQILTILYLAKSVFAGILHVKSPEIPFKSPKFTNSVEFTSVDKYTNNFGPLSVLKFVKNVICYHLR